MSKYIYGIHDDTTADLLAKVGGSVVMVDAIDHGNESSGRDFRYLADKGLTVIGNLRHGYGDGHSGNIPLPEHYNAFAMRFANYVASSQGCTLWVMGNEPNHAAERPEGQPITPEMFATCYGKVVTAVKRIAGDRHKVLLGAVAPWNNQTAYPGNERGDWITYLSDTILASPVEIAGCALHVYTHGLEPWRFEIDNPMDEPFKDRQYDWGVLEEFMVAIDESIPGAIVYITETNPGAGPNKYWPMYNSGWVQNMYDAVDDQNVMAARHGFTPVRGACLYRGHPHADIWCYSDKPGTMEDFRVATEEYQVWDYSEEQPPTPTCVCPHCGKPIILTKGAE